MPMLLAFGCWVVSRVSALVRLGWLSVGSVGLLLAWCVLVVRGWGVRHELA